MVTWLVQIIGKLKICIASFLLAVVVTLVEICLFHASNFEAFHYCTVSIIILLLSLLTNCP